jgi:hypothetical protein
VLNFEAFETSSVREYLIRIFRGNTDAAQYSIALSMVELSTAPLLRGKIPANRYRLRQNSREMAFWSISSQFLFQCGQSRRAAHIVKRLVRHPRPHLTLCDQPRISLFFQRTLLPSRQISQNLFFKTITPASMWLSPSGSRLRYSVTTPSAVTPKLFGNRLAGISCKPCPVFCMPQSSRNNQRCKSLHQRAVINREIGVPIHSTK